MARLKENMSCLNFSKIEQSKHGGVYRNTLHGSFFNSCYIVYFLKLLFCSLHLSFVVVEKKPISNWYWLFLGTIDPEGCPEGTVIAEIGAYDIDQCDVCPHGYYCPGNFPLLCAPGNYCVAGVPEPYQCQELTYNPNPGWWFQIIYFVSSSSSVFWRYGLVNEYGNT